MYDLALAYNNARNVRLPFDILPLLVGSMYFLPILKKHKEQTSLRLNKSM